MVQVYTCAGRRMFPAMKLPAPAAIVSSDGAWRLLAVCRDGTLHVWDLQTLTSLLQASLQPLLASTPSGTAGMLLTLAPLHIPISPFSIGASPSRPGGTPPYLRTRSRTFSL